MEKVDQLENYSRRNNIRVIHLGESCEGNDPVNFFVNWIPATLGQEHFTEPLIIERAHRAFGPRPPADQRPRPVLIRLLKCQDRDKILRIAAQRSRENKGPIKYDGKPVLFFPDLSASLVKCRKEYDRVKTELRSKDIPFALLHPATLRITLPDGRRRFADQIKLFCETNCPSSPNSFILWDTLKAYLRGQIISYKKKYMAEIEKLETDILKLEKEFQQSGSKVLYQSLLNMKLKYNTLHTYKIEKAILRTKQRYYELGEKAHKILSWQLRKEESSRTINAIQTEAGSVSHNPVEINDTFKQFYANLYTSESPEDLTKMDEFLKTDNPILRHLIKMWCETHRSLGLKVGLSPITSETK
ncbi:hypothetical protein F7725_022385 [Dissostichus mawsoni]|uniref:Uncharacterized protein n=1 Tax=Dissostichus mawsoni TaxID=36200 RepID=A0A7J5YXZ3_DISMA|nr:hypothetical protein F7725_022385 [Dissostichus mawsoni]